MPGSTYSTNLKIELMTTGENSGTWGDITNTNLGTALEQAVIGLGNPDYTSDANLTITITNSNAAQAARALVLNVTSVFGALTATRELVVPTIQKQYIVQNNTTGGQSITVKTSAGTGITVPNGRKAHLYVDGTNVIQMFDFVDINGGTIDGVTVGASSASTGAFTTLTASGATTLNGTVALGDAVADTITLNGQFVTGTVFRSAQTATNTLNLAAYDVDGTAYTNLITLTASNTPTLALTSTGVGTINNMSVGATTASTGAFTTLSATGVTTVQAGTVSLPAITTTGDTNTGIFFPAADTIAFTEGGAESMRIDSSGNVGIGVTSPASKLQISSKTLTSTDANLTIDGTSTPKFRIDDLSNVATGRRYLTNNVSRPATIFTADNAAYGVTTIQFDDGFLAFQTAAAGTASPSERMRITSAGSVGIGTGSTAANAKLTVQDGNFALQSTTTSATTSVGYISGFSDRNSSNYEIGRIDFQTGAFADAGNMLFSTKVGAGALTERMRIDSTGNVGIGTSSPATILDIVGSGNPTLTVRGSAGAYTSFLKLQAAGGGTSVINATGATSDALAFQITGSEKMRLNSSGNLGLGVTPSAWSSVSGVFQIAGNAYIASTSHVLNLTANGFFNGSNWVYTSSNFSAQYEQVSGTHRWFTAPSGTAGASASVTSGQSYTVTVLGSSTLAQWQAFFSALVALPTVGQVVTATATGSIVGGGTVTQIITFTQAMTLTAAGNLGVGATSPGAKLEVTSSGSASTAILRNTSSTAATYSELFFAPFTGVTAASAAIRSTYSGFNDSSIEFLTTASTSAPTEKMRIDSAGNFLVGQTSSLGKLTLKQPTGSTVIAANIDGVTSSESILLNVSGFGQANVARLALTAPTVDVRPALTFSLFNGGLDGFQERMRITAAGNVGIGTTSPTVRLTTSTARSATVTSAEFVETGTGSVGDVNKITLKLQNTLGGSTGGAGIGAVLEASSSNKTGLGFYYDSGSGSQTEGMRLDSAGNVQVSAGAVVVWAPAPAAISAAATLTNANIQGQIISTTGTTYTVTMPLGTTMETLVSWSAVNLGYDFYIVNTASGIITLDATEVGVTSLGSMTIASGASAHFRIRRTAANTFVVYRLS